MDTSPRDSYLETQVLTSTPQRLRLMLIEAAIRKARETEQAWNGGDESRGVLAIDRCRDIVSELIAGLQPDQSPLARKILGVYAYIYSTLIEASISRDLRRLVDVVRILEEERQTWQTLCGQMPDRPVVNPCAPEEVAPQRVADMTIGYGIALPHGDQPNSVPFSIEA